MLSFYYIVPGRKYSFYYTNWKGKRELRRVMFQTLEFGSNEWYPEKQFFMRCIDLEKQIVDRLTTDTALLVSIRSFAILKIDLETFTEL